MRPVTMYCSDIFQFENLSCKVWDASDGRVRLTKSTFIYLSGQKRGMTELECIWPVILTSECPKIISSPGIKHKKVKNYMYKLTEFSHAG